MTSIPKDCERTARRSFMPYYTIKYLGLTSAMTLILALVNLWKWPPGGRPTREGLVFLGMTLLCVFVTKYRYAILCAPLGIVALRGAISALLGVYTVTAVIIAVLSGSAFWFTIRRASREHEDLAAPNGYPLREIGLDVVIMTPVVVAVYQLHQFLSGR